MKNSLLLIPVFALTMACSSETPKTENPADLSQEKIENSSKSLNESIKESENKMKKKQSEIDNLLNDI